MLANKTRTQLAKKAIALTQVASTQFSGKHILLHT